MRLICVVNGYSAWHPARAAANFIAELFGGEIIDFWSIASDLQGWAKSVTGSVIFTNAFDLLGAADRNKVIYYVTDIVGNLPMWRRVITLYGKKVDIFASTIEIAREIYKQCGMKVPVQYPPAIDSGLSEPKYCLYSGLLDCDIGVFKESINETFVQLESPDDFALGKIYLHGDYDWMKVLLARSYGVPVITNTCPAEFSLPCDSILSEGANIREWVQGIRNTMRDRDIISRSARQGNQKFSNLDAIVDKVKKQLTLKQQQKAIVAASPNVNRALLEERLSKKSAEVLAKRQTPKIVKNDAPFAGFQRCEYKAPQIIKVGTPSWFPCPSPKVSVVIPMFNSRGVIEDQIKNWDTTSSFNVEIVYVDDADPQRSHQAVIESWTDIKNRMDSMPQVYPQGFFNRIGQVLLLSHNSGFSTACNVGAQHATAEYVVFLNSDTVVTPGWIEPMLETLENNPEVGLVGNLQLKLDGTIDSAGSEWMWDSRSFDHIGRNVFNGKRLSQPMYFSNAPRELLQPGEREMVTGCCFMMRKSLFWEVGGFDIGYRIGYWEDADLNLEVRSRGYKVYWRPDSVIYHRTGHSGASRHPYIIDNARHFYNKWIRTGKIDSLVGSKRP